MLILAIYGMIAFGTFCIAIAPATRTLWKVGGLFFLNWILASLINVNVPVQATTIFTMGLDMLSASLCFTLYLKYKCNMCHYVTWVFMAQSAVWLWFASTGNYHHTMLALNLLFVLNAILIIGGSIHRLVSRNRRITDIPTNEMRRRTDLKTERA